MTDLQTLAERSEPDFMLAGGERVMLDAWLDYHRARWRGSAPGLTDDQLRERSVPPSSMSLLGLVRHMTEVERWLVPARPRAATSSRPLYCPDDNPDGDFDDVDTADVAADVVASVRRASLARRPRPPPSRSTITGQARRGPVSLRWILVHMIEEYARHNGHADLMRERIDGAVGE